ncbi:MAG: hypothetical protein LBJ15_22560 [Comamonas sp.]|jgi:hypothetical protein|uniref:hypothetical protein n=1 Tax=Comamonas sp. TaxID=34028 RepID=UPI0028311876|nr:hypothetical protein [Comamonas sp.]MDR0216768.1 hypothetical protein [Comamonas sp.]
MDKKLSEITMSGAIRLLRELAAVGVLAYLCVRLFSGDLSLDFGKLTSSELVSFLLAFFSIGLSAAFYFAATNQSNQFYDNVNKFSKDTAELLGRLDEQVKGLGGKQSELKLSIDQYYHQDRSKPNEVQEVKEQAEEVKENLAKMLNDLLDKSGLTRDERNRFEEELRAKDAELGNLREKMGRLSTFPQRNITGYATEVIKKIGLKAAITMPLNQLLIEVYNRGITPFKNDMKSMGYVTISDETNQILITARGINMINKALEMALSLPEES